MYACYCDMHSHLTRTPTGRGEVGGPMGVVEQAKNTLWKSQEISGW